MKYEKPEVVVLGSATAAILGGSKGVMAPLDMHDKPTVGAYEADE